MKQSLLIVIAINAVRFILLPFVSKLNFEWYDASTPLYEANSLIYFLVKNLSALFKNTDCILHIFFFIVSILAQWSIFLLLKKVIRPKRKYLAWIVICSTIFTTLFTIAPIADSLVSLFWILTLLSFYNAIFDNDFKAWLLAGIFMGLTTLIKLTGLALPIGLLVFLIFSSRYRHHLYKIGPYISLITALILSMPIWLGYLSTESSTLSVHIAQTAYNLLGLQFNSFTSFIIFQLILIFPVLYIGLWWLTFKYFARIFNKPNQVDPEFWFLLSFFTPLFVGFHLIALFDWVDFLGLTPIYLTGFVVLLKLCKQRWFIWSIGLSLVFHLLFIIALVRF